MRDPYAATVPCLPTSTRLPELLLDQQELEGSRKGAVGGAPAPGQRGAGALSYRGASAQQLALWMPVVPSRDAQCLAHPARAPNCFLAWTRARIMEVVYLFDRND